MRVISAARREYPSRRDVQYCRGKRAGAAGDPPRLVASAARAKAELGWRPHYVSLEETMATAWQWEQQRKF